MIEANDNDAAKEGADHENEELVERLRKWEQDSRRAHSAWKKEAKRAYDLVAGDQWDQDDKSALLDQMRQPITFNRIGPMVDAVAGAEVLNRQQVVFYGREVGDAQVSEVLTGAADWVRDSCDAEDHESDAFSDLIICGMGWTETFLDYEESPEGDIRVPRLDPLEMGWDPNAKERNLNDSRYRYRTRSFDKDAFKAKYGQEMYDRCLAAEEQEQNSFDAGIDHAQDEYRYDDGTSGKRARVTVVQMQWWDLEDAMAVENPQTGEIEALEPQQYKALAKMALMRGMPPLQAAKQKRRKYYQAIYAGNVLVEKKSLKCNTFTLKCMTGKRDRNKGIWYGLVRAMADPQMWANKWLSQLLHIINANAKGGLIYETGVFTNPAKARQEWARPDSMTEVQPGALSSRRMEQKTPPPLPAGLKDLLEFSVESLPQVSGINLEMLGLVQREQAGVLEQQRKRSGYAILAVFFDALRKYRKDQGRVLLDYIKRYISDGRLIRIKGQGGEQYVPLIRQPGVLKYDVVVDEAPMSANQKDMVWGMLMQMMPMLKDAPIPMDVWGKLLEYSPLPGSLSAEISKAITQPQQPDPLAERAKNAEVANLEADVMQKQSTATLNMARAQKEGMPDQMPAGPGPIEHAQAAGALERDRAAAMLSQQQARKTAIEADLLPIDMMQKHEAARQKAQQMQFPLAAGE